MIHGVPDFLAEQYRLKDHIPDAELAADLAENEEELALHRRVLVMLEMQVETCRVHIQDRERLSATLRHIQLFHATRASEIALAEREGDQFHEPV